MMGTTLLDGHIDSLVGSMNAGKKLNLDFSSGSEEDRTRKHTVLAIVCPSYSGSTLLTALLGSHSSIIGAGELHWLLSNNREQVEKIISKSESLLQTNLIWKELFEQRLRPDELYDAVFAKAEQKILIDSSKRVKFFEQIVPLHRSMQFVFVYLLKHPLRLLASHIMHRGSSPECENMDRGRLIEYILTDLHNQLVYQQVIASRIGYGNRILVVKYEDIVCKTRETVKYILDELGLSFEQDMLNYDRMEHDMLGGNAGPRSQISRSRSGGDARFASDIQGAFYKDLHGLKMDNNYRDVFTEEEISRLNQSEKMRALLHIMGYEAIH